MKEISIEIHRHLQTEEFLVLSYVKETLSMKVRAVSLSPFKTTNRNSALVVQLDYFLTGYHEWWQIESRCDQCDAVAIVVTSR